MDIDAIQKLVEEDMKIDATQLDIESIRIPSIHNKYLKILQSEALVYKKLSKDYNELRKERWLYYMGKAPETTYINEPFDLKITRSDVDVFIDGDPKITTAKAKMEFQQEKVKYLEEVIRGINNRNWNIRNAIEWKKFMSGIS